MLIAALLLIITSYVSIKRHNLRLQIYVMRAGAVYLYAFIFYILFSYLQSQMVPCTCGGDHISDWKTDGNDIVNIIAIILLFAHGLFSSAALYSWFKCTSSVKKYFAQLKDPKLTFDEFKQYYLINPKPWLVFMSEDYDFGIKNKIYNVAVQKHFVMASYYDYWKFGKFFQQLEASKKARQNDVDRATLYESVLKDIQEFRKKNDLQVEQDLAAIEHIRQEKKKMFNTYYYKGE